MADRFLIAGSSGAVDWSSTAFWSATRYGATGAAAPVSNDVVYILDGGGFTINAGLSNAAVDLNGLFIAAPCTIGGAGSSLNIAVSGTSGATCQIMGAGSYNITAGTNGIDILDVAMASPGTVNLSGGTTADAYVGELGTVNVLAGAVISGVLKSAGATMRIEDNATDIPTAKFSAGRIDCYRDLDAITVGALATLTMYEDTTVDGSIENFGAFNAWSSGTIAQIIAHAGSRQTTVGSRANALTITNAEVYATVADFFDRDRIITFSNAARRIGNRR